MKKENSWMVTHTGKQFFPYDPTIEQIDSVDIAHALSLLTRFNGHAKHMYSVGQHSLNCLQLARFMGYDTETQLHILLHDSSEAFLSDIPRPIKQHLNDYRELENKVQNVILRKYGLSDPTEEQHLKIKLVDNELLYWEGKFLTHDVENWTSKYKSKINYTPDIEIFMYRNPVEVEMEFLYELEILRLDLEKGRRVFN